MRAGTGRDMIGDVSDATMCEGCRAPLTLADLAARAGSLEGRHPDVIAAAAELPDWSWCADCAEAAWYLLALDVAQKKAAAARQGRRGLAA